MEDKTFLTGEHFKMIGKDIWFFPEGPLYLPSYLEYLTLPQLWFKAMIHYTIKTCYRQIARIYLEFA